jgi:hypothetical protein
VSTFDVSTQRRTQSIDAALILPAAETLATLYDGSEGSGEEGLKKRLEAVRQGLEKRRATSADLTNISHRISSGLKTGGRSLPRINIWSSFIRWPRRLIISTKQRLF